MLDEHYRYLAAVRDRREYVEDQLQKGSPVVGLRYNNGILILTIGKGQRKIFEIHDEIALGAVGHTADIERLRMIAIEAASVQAFQNSVDDVTLHRLTNFLLSPTIKHEFEAVFSAPTVAKLILAELKNGGQFVALNYDGTSVTDRNAIVIAGSAEIEFTMRDHLTDLSENLELDRAIELALETWAIGRELSIESPEDDESEHFEIDLEKLRQTISESLKSGEIEAGVLEISRRSKSKFRLLSADETNLDEEIRKIR